ncbi:MAG: zinc-binding dehydrogenase [Nostoc sp. LPT]|uniref:zinc-binding dehydrogenase n=1 Tax=uncultured Nostoc sp. TaxID=340711 RepID=UPI001DC6C355|nr:zinc-binding dehydrogenase [Nostoc sp. LPT]
MIQRVLTAFFPSQKAKFLFEKPNAEDLVFLKELIEASKIFVVIDYTYPLVELAAAHGYRESERAVGKIA